MRKLRRISLEDFDKLTSSEASKLVGGKDPYTYNPPSRKCDYEYEAPKFDPPATIYVTPGSYGVTGTVTFD